MAVEQKPVPPATPPAPEGPARRRARGGFAREALMRVLTLREGSIIVVTLVTFAYFAISTNNYLTYSNWKALLPYFCFLAIMAAGQVFVMTLGEIDLSIGAMYLVTPIFFWKLNSSAGIPLGFSLALSLLIAMAFGAVNGLFTAYIGIPSFVATLAMLFFLDGLALILTHSQQVTTPGTAITHTTSFARVFGAGTYAEFIWALVIVGVLQVILSLTRWGTYTVATGGNRLGADEAGIQTRLVIVRNFVLCALTAGFAGLLEAIRTSAITPDPSGSQQDLLLAIAAVIIGGTLMTGGEGTVVGALVGALFLGVLQDGLVVKGVNATYEYLYIGIAIAVAMFLYVLVRRVRLGSGRA
jgi:simple sugar transport system permease protein